jgi:hypothetical protein
MNTQRTRQIVIKTVLHPGDEYTNNKTKMNIQIKQTVTKTYTWEKHKNTSKKPFLHSNIYPTRCNVA